MSAWPFFEAGPTPEECARRRALLVSYHFPPDTAVGGLRWAQHARYLAERGWKFDVIARDLARLERRDDARLAILPGGTRVFNAAEPEAVAMSLERFALRAYHRLRPPKATSPGPEAATAPQPAVRNQGPKGHALVRAYSAWAYLNGEELWARAATGLGRELLREQPYDVVVSSGPPHFAHEAARTLARTARVPLIIDFRDPWSGIERLADGLSSPVWYIVAKKYEARAVRDASLVIMNTDASRDDMRLRYPAAAERIVTIRNGSDDEALPAVSRSKRFTIRFAGSIYLDRDPRNVFRAAASVVRRLSLTPDDFLMEFIGDGDASSRHLVRAMAVEAGLEGFVDVGPPRTRQATMEFLAGATMLLNLPQDLHMCVPAKIFEYVRFDAWLLILAEPNSATATTLDASNADLVDPADVVRMAAVIEARYLQHARGERPVAANRDGRFDRKRQVDCLAELMEHAAETFSTER